MRHHITLTSSAGRNKTPDNTLTEFTNVLPQPLTLRGGAETFLLRLVNIGISIAASHHHEPGKYVKVVLSELEAQRVGRGFQPVAGGFTYPPEKTGEEINKGVYSFHNFAHAPWLPVRLVELRQIRVRLEEADTGEPLLLQAGAPTVLQVEILDGDGMDEEEEGMFTVLCGSRQTGVYPDNTAGLFTSPIPEESNFGAYEVAMLNAVYPPRMNALEREAAMHVSTQRLRTTTISVSTHSMTYDTFIYDVRRLLLATHYARVLLVSRGPDDGKVTFMLSDWGLARGMSPVKLRLEPAFAAACGQHANERGRMEIVLDRDRRVFKFPEPTDHYVPVPQPLAMLNCSIVKPSVMGGQNANLLQCVPIPVGNAAEYVSMYEPKHLSFHPAMDRPTTYISFQFTDSQGRQREFQNHHNDQVIVTLLFRRRRT
jgi:hypothetical protein